jgi:hypothetical protein
VRPVRVPAAIRAFGPTQAGIREHVRVPVAATAIDPDQGGIPATGPARAATTAIDPDQEGSATGHHSAGSAAIDPVTAIDPGQAATTAIGPDPVAIPAIDLDQGVFDLQSPGSVAIGQEREGTRATGQEVVWSVIGLAATRIVPGSAITWESATGPTSATT